MTLFNIDSKLCDVIFYDPSVITVINRFGINLGVGDSSISEICQSHNLDESFFLTIINTFLHEEYFPEKILKSFSISKIVDYLNQTDSYYEQFQLPNIERHFNSLIMRSESDDSNLHLLMKFFQEVKNELLSNIDNDRKKWFPKLKELEKNHGGIEETELYSVEDCHHPIADKLNDLKSFFIIHLRGKYDVNLCHAVIATIISLEKDLKQNNRIRDRILRPMEQVLTKIS